METFGIRNKTVIIKVTNDCNLRCQYCYFSPEKPFVSRNGIMSVDVLERMIEQIMTTIPGGIDFIWHGGEPLIAGIDFYQKVVELQKRYNPDGQRTIINSVQTNAVLINEDWIDFFEENDFQVGVSLDGPQFIHDKYRVDSRGKGSFKRVNDNLEKLINRKIDVGILAVVTPYTTRYPDRFFDFFVDHGYNNFDILLSVDIDPVTGNPTQNTVSPNEFAEFAIRIFDLWLKRDDPRISIRYLESIVALMIGGKSSLCEFAGTCGDFITVDSVGNVYPCDNLIPDGPFLIGNLVDQPLETILTTAYYQKLYLGLSSTPSACKDCKWVNICRGGCTHHRAAFYNSFESKDYYCEGKKRIFNHIEKRLTDIIMQII